MAGLAADISLIETTFKIRFSSSSYSSSPLFLLQSLFPLGLTRTDDVSEMPRLQESPSMGGGDPIMRYVEFVKTVLRDLDNEPLLETFLRKGVASQTLGEEFARSMHVNKAYRIKGFPMQVFYEEDGERTDNRVQYPVKPFARRGGNIQGGVGRNRHRSPWHDLAYRQYGAQWWSWETNTVHLPWALAGPRFASIHSTSDPHVSEEATGVMEKWSSNKQDLGLPAFTYYDGFEEHGFYETWEQLEVVVCNSGSVYDLSRNHNLGGGRNEGMLTSPSMTYLKLSLWKEPPQPGSTPMETVLFLVHILGGFPEVASPVPRNLVPKWNSGEHRIELHPPTPSSHSSPTHSLSHRQQLRYGQTTAGGGMRLEI